MKDTRTPSFTSIEYANLILVNKIIDNWEAIKLTLTVEQLKPKKGLGKKIYDIYDQLVSFRKKIIKGIVNVKYYYSKNHLPIFPGRQFAGSPSYQGMKRWMRHTLCRDLYDDFDIKNCHPTLLSQLCKKKGWETPVLDDYLVNREELLKEMVGLCREDAKEVILSMMNYSETSAYRQLDYRPLWLVNFKKEIEDIHIKLFEDPEFATLLENLIKHNKTFNKMGSLMNHILCNIENKCLVKALQYTDTKHIVLVFDGYQKLKAPSPNFDLMSEYIFRETGYQTEWIIKPMDEGIDLSMYPDLPPENEVPLDEELTDMGIFDLVYSQNKDYIKQIGKQIYLFNTTTGMWDKDGFGIYIGMCRKCKVANKIKKIRDSFVYCKELPDETDFYIQGKKLRLGKILYKNGVKDIETGQFVELFNSTYFFTKIIPRNFNPIKNTEMFDRTLQTLFYAPHKKEIAIELLKALGLAMTGRNPEEAEYDNLGNGSNGKSLLMEGFLEAFPGYAEPFNISTIRVDTHAKASEHSDSKVMMSDIRIGFASEGTAGMLVDSEQFKRLTTQEPFYARECGEKQVKVKPEMTLFSFGQQPLVFDKIDKAVQRRRRGFPWNVTFEKCQDGSLDFLKTVEAYEALDHIIQYGYDLWKKNKFIQIEELLLFKEELDQEQDVFGDLLEQKYIVMSDVGNKLNWIKSTEVYKTFKELKLSDWTIKRKFEFLGVKCVKTKAGNDGQGMYFQGLTKIIPKIMGLALTIDEDPDI